MEPAGSTINFGAGSGGCPGGLGSFPPRGPKARRPIDFWLGAGLTGI